MLFELGNRDKPWTKQQIDDFMDDMRAEIFDSQPKNRGQSDSTITEIARESEGGEKERYERDEGGDWRKVE